MTSRANATTVEYDHAIVKSAIADLFCVLANADLTATSFKILFDILERTLRSGQISWAVDVESTASALCVHRNSVGLGYARLVKAGLINRVVVPARGAPTRTCLAGPALHFVKILSEGLGDTRTSHSHTTMVACGHATTASAAAFHPDVHAALRLKVPAADLIAAMNGRLAGIDPAWGLSGQESACLLSFKKDEPTMHKKLCVVEPIMPKNLGDATRAVRELKLQDQLKSFVQDAIERIGGDPQQAARRAMEIAFQVQCGGLGKGNEMAGFRVGMKLLATGRWSTPRGLPGSWYSQAHDFLSINSTTRN